MPLVFSRPSITLQLKKPLFLHERAAFGDFSEVRNPPQPNHRHDCVAFYLRLSDANIRYLFDMSIRLDGRNQTRFGNHPSRHLVLTILCLVFPRQVLRRYDALHGLPPCLVHCFTGEEKVRRVKRGKVDSYQRSQRQHAYLLHNSICFVGWLRNTELLLARVAHVRCSHALLTCVLYQTARHSVKGAGYVH